MFEVQQTPTFANWFGRLRDRRAQQRIAKAIALLEGGHVGNLKRFGAVTELRVDHGPGYRVYLTQRGDTIILLLCGGDKSSQERDIARAREMIAALA
ncbi:MAG: type II toxin-antitoxin system RelE/ParE family toxin [Sphingomonas sp.]|uniref:type II toxin-antitoxin system RelE/ParE family toxin n=1 Tax=Sphingomonas sp. TaxID=28214 RepID=UPI0025F65B3D|nr:type II toxin-antitoxin system RelE/ParE family toxin [Sphingomonas sp.]MBY0283394.1 type II toxin-antitoxin system RelE/ParE family toxin [Sphingomonas sp.]